MQTRAGFVLVLSVSVRPGEPCLVGEVQVQKNVPPQGALNLYSDHKYTVLTMENPEGLHQQSVPEWKSGEDKS